MGADYPKSSFLAIIFPKFSDAHPKSAINGLFSQNLLKFGGFGLVYPKWVTAVVDVGLQPPDLVYLMTKRV